MPRAPVTTLLAALAFALAPITAPARPDGVLRLQVVDAQTGEPLATRVELKRGDRPVRNRGLGVGRFHDWLYLDGQAELGLRRGQYTFDLYCGPEFKPLSGHFEIDRRADDGKTIEMHRVVSLEDEGWQGADLLASREEPWLDIAVRAAGLAYVPLTAHQYEEDRWRKLTLPQPAQAGPARWGNHAARLRRPTGDLLFVRPNGPLTDADIKTIGTGALASLQAARGAGLRVVAADASSWALPVWLAAGVLDAIVVIDPNDTQGGGYRGPWGRPRDGALYPRLAGKAAWREAIYFKVLEAGLKIAPAAGSNTGVNDLPLGACRVYAAPAGGVSPENWWRSLAAGEALVTNGPLLRSTPMPGKTYKLIEGATDVSLGASLTTATRVEYLEIIQNGEPVQSIPLSEVAAARGQLPAVDCSGSGWFLLRAQAADAPGYQRAMTGPYYYQPLGGAPRVSRKACAFFLAWLEEAGEVLPPEDREAATEYWRGRLAEATAD